MKVVDPHVHLWDTRAVSYPWLERPGVAFSGDNRLLPLVHDVAALWRNAGEIEILGTVNVEANPADPIAEAHWLQSQADHPANNGHPHGIVAFVDLSRPEAPGVMERLAQIPNVRGIRQILNIHADRRYNYVDRNFLADPIWHDNLSRLAHYRWSFDLQIYPDQWQAAAHIIECNPRIHFIVNHTGMLVDRASGYDWRQWRISLKQLSQYDNVAIKLSGLAMFDHQWTVDSFRPLVNEAIEYFGTRRCMFASNFPIDRLHGSYPSIWGAYSEIVGALSASERHDLFVRNAIKYYHLNIHSEAVR